MEAIQDAVCRALGRRRVGRRWQPGDARRRVAARAGPARAHAARRPRPVRGLLPLPRRRGRRGTFADALPAIVNEPEPAVHVLVSIREDAWAKLDLFEGRIPRLFGNYLRVDHLDRTGAREAIERPVEEWNSRLAPGDEPYTLEPALVDAVIDAAAAGGLALAEDGARATRRAANAEEIEAPYLQLVMDRLWRATSRRAPTS